MSGTVSSAATAKPLPGMTVAAYDATGQLRGTATTDSNGHYSLTLPADHYRLLAYDPAGIYATAFAGDADSFETTPLTELVTSATVNLELMKAGYVAGSTRPNLTVAAYNLSGTRRAFTTANASGDYSLALPPGDYKIAVYDESGAYATLFYRSARTFGEAQIVHVDEAQTASATIRPDLVARIGGKTIDKTSGAFLQGIVVYAYTAGGAFVSSATVNALGTFSLALPAGTYKLVAADPNRVYAAAFSGGTNSFETAAVIDVPAGSTMSNLNLTLERAAKIGGHVSPVADALVVAYNLDGTMHTSARTDVNGAYELLVAPGTYKLAAIDESQTYATQFHSHRPDFASASAIFVVSGGNHGGFDFALERAGRISGSVGAPNINVRAYDAAGVLVASTRSGSDGRYTLALVPGAYRVLAFDDQLIYTTSYAGGATSFDAAVPIVVVANTTTDANITLRNGVKVTGTVFSSSGEALDNVEIFALDANGNRVAATMSQGGTFTLPLAAGTYRFAAFDRTGRFAPQTLSDLVTITSQAPLPIRFVLSGAGRTRSARH